MFWDNTGQNQYARSVAIRLFKADGDRLTDGEQDDSQWWGGQGMKGLSKKEKGPMDVDNSVVIAGGEGCKGTKW